MLELYNNAYSTCSQKVRLALAEKKIEWIDRQIIFAKSEHLTPEYLKLNPNGVVPIQSARAQERFPTRPIAIINPYAPGSSIWHLLRCCAGSSHRPIRLQLRNFRLG